MIVVILGGGRGTRLSLVERDAGVKRPVREERYASRDHNSLAAVVGRFLADVEARPTAA
jgi:glucokinase